MQKNKKIQRALNVSGDKRLLIKLKSGKPILIGTQDETGLTDFLEDYFKNTL